MLILQLKKTASPFICLLFKPQRFCRGLIRLRIVQSVSKDIRFKSSKKGVYYTMFFLTRGGENKSFIICLLGHGACARARCYRPKHVKIRHAACGQNNSASASLRSAVRGCDSSRGQTLAGTANLRPRRVAEAGESPRSPRGRRV